MKSRPIDRSVLPAKLIRPRPHEVFPRRRLYTRLDAALEHRVLWLAAPAGTGKTVLASSYLEARGLPHLWYQVDEDDGDPASFFHYLGLAARELASSRFPPLPVLTPEYLPDLGSFARRFFEQLYRQLAPPTVLVLDNYQEVPEASPLHELVRDGGALLPPGLNLVILSRTEPPPVFARLRLHGDLAVIGFDELRLTLDEAQGIATARQPSAAPEFVERCHAEAQGWTVGLVLLLEQSQVKPGGPLRRGESARTLLFDYFVGEIFERLTTVTRTVLLETAVLPKMQLPWLEALTGSAEAGRMLVDLYRRDFFVLKREEPDAVFEYHPLFRAFLLAQVRQELAAEALAELSRRAAAILAQAGQVEDAMPLYLDAGDFDALAVALPSLAPLLLAQGRHQTLAHWLGAVPEPFLYRHGELLYWFGQARLPYDQGDARHYLESAFAVFDREDESTGLYLCWAAIVYSYFLEWNDFSQLDRWIKVYEQLRVRHPDWPSVEVEVQVCVTATAFVYRRILHPELPAWAEQARALLESGVGGQQSMQLAGHLLHYYVSIGDLVHAPPVVDRLNALTAAGDISPLVFIIAKMQSALFHWSRGEAVAGLRQIREGLERAEASGFHRFDKLLNAYAVYAGLLRGDLGSAEEFLGRARAMLDDRRFLDASHYHHLAGLLAQQRGNAAAAIDHFRAALRMSVRAGTPLNMAINHACLAWSLFQLGRDAEAFDYLRLARDHGSAFLDYLCLATEASMHLERGETAEGRAVLARMLALSRESGGLVIGWWGPDFMARLYIAALEAGIEVPYVQALIRRMALTPPDPSKAPESWPWPLAIRTLGRFEIIKDGVPLHFAGKAQQKPLDLLMALVAHGGTEVPWTQLADALWPDAEGDAGYRALITTVQRLRKLLKQPEAVLFNEGALGFDSRRVWVDTGPFERSLERIGAAIRSADRAEMLAARQRVLALYRGPFLERIKAPWAVALRERLRARHAGGIRDLGRALEALGHEQEAADLYRKSLEADPSVEIFHQHLIHLYLRQGRVSEARAAYEHCRRVLAASSANSPSRETEALIRPYL